MLWILFTSYTRTQRRLLFNFFHRKHARTRQFPPHDHHHQQRQQQPPLSIRLCALRACPLFARGRPFDVLTYHTRVPRQHGQVLGSFEEYSTNWQVSRSPQRSSSTHHHYHFIATFYLVSFSHLCSQHSLTIIMTTRHQQK